MKLTCTLIIVLFSFVCFAQAPPEAFNYSGAARDAQGNPISEKTIGVELSILKGSPTGAVQYRERHFVNTDKFGVFNCTVGQGSVQQGTFSAVNWSNDSYYLRVGLDANGGTNFVVLGTTQLLSVPYALYAKSAGSVNVGSGSGGYTSPPIYTVGTGVTDIDGNSYKTIKLGTQEWMAENLKVTKYRNGNPIPNVTDSAQWIGLTTGAWCTFNNEPANNAIYGKLYNWYAVADNRNICPTGWHVPTKDEWEKLIAYIDPTYVYVPNNTSMSSSSYAGLAMKSVGSIQSRQSTWLYDNIASNSSGFSAEAGGGRSNFFFGTRIGAYFWSSTESSSIRSYCPQLSRGSTLQLFDFEKNIGLSIRCIKD